MVKLVGSDIWRGGQKIGWVEGSHVRDHDGKKVGYFEGNFIYDENARKIAYVEGDYLYSEGGSINGSSKMPLEKIAEDVEGGVISAIGRAAIYILLGS